MTQADLLRRVIDVLEARGITYMVVGSFASGAFGEPRLTHDIDIVVELRPDQAVFLCAAFPSDEFYVSLPAAVDAVRTRGMFNLIHPTSGNKIDFMVSRDDPWGRSQLARRQRILILPDREGYTAAPEDLIISKLLYYQEGGSEKHLRDITGILKVSGEQVDRDYVARWAAQLGVTEIWQAVLDRLARG